MERTANGGNIVSIFFDFPFLRLHFYDIVVEENGKFDLILIHIQFTRIHQCTLHSPFSIHGILPVLSLRSTQCRATMYSTYIVAIASCQRIASGGTLRFDDIMNNTNEMTKINIFWRERSVYNCLNIMFFSFSFRFI